jgi:hypothetical protein
MKKVGYVLWAATLFVVCWTISLVSALLAGKARIKIDFKAEGSVNE